MTQTTSDAPRVGIAAGVTAGLGTVAERLRDLVDGLADAAVLVDRELRPILWNAAYTNAVGLRGRRMNKAVEERARCHDLFALECCETGCLAKQCFDSKRAVRVHELTGRSKKIEVEAQTLIVSAIPVMGDNGDVVGVLEVYRDVTAEARVQERYRALLDRERRRAELLEQLVKERTADLERSLEELRTTRQQLIQSEKLSSLGQLVAGIAHEINNPINFIYGNLDFLEQYIDAFRKLIRAADGMQLTGPQREGFEGLKKELDFEYIEGDLGKLLASVRTGTERASAIVRDLRTFIHGGTHQRTLIDLPQCIETTWNLLAHEARGRVQLVRDFAQALPSVMGNEGQINQVFMNLLVNAIHAIKGTGTVTVRIQPRDKGVAVEVADTGVGISEADILRVFDPFFTTKPVGQGTGLGLSISYSIVDAHGGRITVQSALGHGATFAVWLPTTPAPAPAKRPA